MREGWRARLDGVLALLTRLTLRVFFREIEVVGFARVPRGVPLLVVANHVNALIDPLLIVAFLGRRVRIVAKSTLWRHPVIAPLLVLARGVPVYRRQDGTDTTRNFDTFRRCRAVLAGGGAVLLFPEGTSHSQPYRLPLKTGAARIALETEACHGPLGLRIIPVGLRYDAKGEFRSRVVIQVGDPIDPAPERERYGRHGRLAVQALTERIACALDVVASYGQGLADAPPSARKPAHRALLALPMAVGVALNWVPYRLPGWIADRLARARGRSGDLQAAGGAAHVPPRLGARGAHGGRAGRRRYRSRGGAAGSPHRPRRAPLLGSSGPTSARRRARRC